MGMIGDSLGQVQIFILYLSAVLNGSCAAENNPGQHQGSDFSDPVGDQPIRTKSGTGIVGDIGENKFSLP